MPVLLLAEHDNKSLKDSTNKALTAAKALGGDVHNLQIANPQEMESRLNQIPGIVTVGLFANRPADVILIAGDGGVKRMDRR